MADYNTRTANVFRQRPFGMPEIDDSSVNDLFSQVVPLVANLKDADLLRQKELMRFQHDLNRPVPVAAPVTRGPNAQKTHITQYAPPTAMQQQIRQENVADKANQFKMGQLQTENQAKLDLGKQRTDAEMAQLTTELNSRRLEGEAERESRERVATTNRQAQIDAAAAQREFTANQNSLNRADRGWQSVMIDDPNDPTKKIAVRMNLASGEVQPITHNGKPVDNLTKPGTPPRGGQLTQPKNIVDIRKGAQESIEEIKNVLGDDDKLTSKGKTGFGFRALGGLIPETDSKSARASIKRIQSQQILNLIGEMKAQSRTGATGFGAMNKSELGILENAASILSDPYISPEDGEKALVKIKKQLQKIMQEDSATQPDKDAPGTVSTGKKPKLDRDELIERYYK